MKGDPGVGAVADHRPADATDREVRAAEIRVCVAEVGHHQLQVRGGSHLPGIQLVLAQRGHRDGNLAQAFLLALRGHHDLIDGEDASGIRLGPACGGNRQSEADGRYRQRAQASAP